MDRKGLWAFKGLHPTPNQTDRSCTSNMFTSKRNSLWSWNEDKNCFRSFLLHIKLQLHPFKFLYLIQETFIFIKMYVFICIKRMDGIVLSPSLCIVPLFLEGKSSLATVCSLLVTFLLRDLIPCDKLIEMKDLPGTLQQKVFCS